MSSKAVIAVSAAMLGLAVAVPAQGASGVHPGSPPLECSHFVPPAFKKAGRIVPIYVAKVPVVVTFIDGSHAKLRFTTKRQACLWVKAQMKRAGWTRRTAKPYVTGWKCVAPPGPDITCTRRGATIVWQYN